MTTTFRRPFIANQALTLPGHYFTDPAIFAHEQSAIFGERWFLGGRSEDVAAPGQYLLLDHGPENLIVVRDQAGQLHAHYNICRHRGTRMCEGSGGQFGETIQCPYHAWTYGLDGRLLNARHMQDAPGFEKAAWPLMGVRVAEWEGFFFINMSADGEPFEAAFAPLIGRFARWNMADLRRGARIVYDLQANWKLIVQNYSECYHCPLIHPELSALSPWQSGRNDLMEGPFLGGYMDLNHTSMTVDGQSARPPLPSLPPEDHGRVYYYSIFPNMLLSMHPDYVMAHRLRPLSPTRTEVTCEWYFAAEQVTKPDFDPRDAVEFWDLTNRQDWKVCELSQLGVSSRAYRPGPYAQQEGLLWQFDQEYLRALGE